MVKVGVVGKGSFGKKIIDKLKELSYVKVTWTLDSSCDWWLCGDVDWVVIATPNEFHYEQAKYFLEKKINVFCEKPACFSVEAIEELISIAKKNQVYFYIDDVLYYEEPIPQEEYIYKKWGGTKDNIVDRMAYHHFYLLYDNLHYDLRDIIPTVVVTNNLPLHKQFKLYFTKNVRYRFEYNFEWYNKKEHNLITTFDGDALLTMLDNVLSKKVNFEMNHKRSLFATSISIAVKKALYGTCNVIGAGIYGTTAAIKLACAGYIINLYEQKSDILQSASSINQYRLHRGYHYPRSKETIASCSKNELKFQKFYSRSILSNFDHFYSIAKEDSLVTSTEYLKVLDEHNLEWRVVEPMPGCDITIQVEENLFDPNLLKEIVEERIKGVGINLYLNHRKRDLDQDINIVATYASLNDLSEDKDNYQYELCEKPLFKLPERYKNKSIVIMDGPFMCFDPYSDTGYHLGGNVVHAIHSRNNGTTPDIPPAYREYIDRGIIKEPKFTNVPRFIESAKNFFPEIENAVHIGSMFTIRTVLPYKDATDERPTIVKRTYNDFVLFSGKIGNCVQAAEDIVKELKNNYEN